MSTSAPQGYFQTQTPVCLSSPFNVVAGSSGVPNYELLTYPFRKPIYVEEIRVDLLLPGASRSLGAFVYAQFQLGQHYLMKDPTPVWLLGTFMSQSQEEGVGVSHYRWRLPQPLYVQAGEVLRATFSRQADGLDPISGFVSYAGRTCSPELRRPKVIPVPYVAPFVTSSDVYEQSNERHLFNPFDKPVHVQRLTGRFLNVLTGTMVRGLTASPTSGFLDPAVQIDDSWGGKVAVDLTGPGDIWDIVRAAWTVDTEMPPKGMYLVKVWNLNQYSRIHTAMVGTREEALG